MAGGCQTVTIDPKPLQRHAGCLNLFLCAKAGCLNLYPASLRSSSSSPPLRHYPSSSTQNPIISHHFLILDDGQQSETREAATRPRARTGTQRGFHDTFDDRLIRTIHCARPQLDPRPQLQPRPLHSPRSQHAHPPRPPHRRHDPDGPSLRGPQHATTRMPALRRAPPPRAARAWLGRPSHPDYPRILPRRPPRRGRHSRGGPSPCSAGCWTERCTASRRATSDIANPGVQRDHVPVQAGSHVRGFPRVRAYEPRSGEA